MNHRLALLGFCMLLLLTNTKLNAQAIDQFDTKKGFTLNGSVGASMITYNASGIDSRRDPFVYYLTGGLNIGLFGYSMPFSFNYSNRKASYAQPFNNFKFNPSYKWARAYFGTTSMNFSDYTLAGHQFSGVGVELTPGKWDIAAMYGKLKSAIEPDFEDPSRSEPSFKRTGYGVKVGYNAEKWGAGVNIFRAYDHENSLQYLTPQSELYPLENTAIGINARKNIGSSFFVDGEYSFSILNQRSSAITAQNPDNSLIKSSTRRYYDAMNFGVGFQQQWYGLQLRYERVAPDYQTLGAYYFTNDMQNITIVPNLRLLAGKLNINGNLGFQRDNLNNQKTAKTKRFVGAVGAVYVPGEKWNFSANYSNFNTFTKHRLQDDPYYKDELDSLNFYQVSQSLNGSAGYNFGTKDRKQNIMLALAYQKSSDEQKANPNLSGSNIYTSNLSYTYSIVPTKVTLSCAANFSQSKSAMVTSTFVGPTVSAGKVFLNNMLRANIGIGYNYNKSSGEAVNNQSSILNNRISVNFTPKTKDDKGGKHNLGLNTNFMKSFVNQANRSNCSELTTTLNYTYTF